VSCRAGPLSFLIKEKGSLEAFQRKLRDAGLDNVRMQLAAPPKESLTLQL